MAASADWVCTKNHMPKKSIKNDSAFRTRTFSSEPVAERNQCGLLWTALLFLGTAFSFRSSGDLELDEAFATPGGFSPCRMFRVDLPISWSYYKAKRKTWVNNNTQKLDTKPSPFHLLFVEASDEYLDLSGQLDRLSGNS